MQKKYNTVVLIGRFQPCHSAHMQLIQRAATIADHILIIIGSANQPRTYKNPWTIDERKYMLNQITSSLSCEVNIASVEDNIYNNQEWVISIQDIVNQYIPSHGKNIALIGHIKDDSSFYLKMFPQWDMINIDLIEPLNATNIRELYFKDSCNLKYLANVVPQPTMDFLKEFMQTSEYETIIREREFIENYKKQFAGLPYPPVFVTSDCIVIQSGHVLMIKRRAFPGKGLLAIPGGFLTADEDTSMLECAIRELKEETGIKIPVPVLKGSIKGSKVFDAIDRSARGRTITHAFCIILPDGELPKVKGSDDAEKALWIPIADIKRNECFEDHADILKWAIGIA